MVRLVRLVLSVVLVVGLAVWPACSFNAEGIPVVPGDARVDGPGDRDGRPDAPTDSDPGEASPDTASDLPITDLIVDQPIPPDTVSPDAAILCTDWTPAPKHFKPCDVGTPKAGLSLTTAGVWIYNTDTGWLTDPNNAATMPQSTVLTLGGLQVRVLSVTSFMLASGVTLRAKGNRPLVVAAWYSATVNGTINANSVRDLVVGTQAAGAGANPGACSAVAATAGQENNTQGGGGGGGGFGGDGGDGGDGDDGDATHGKKGSAVSSPTELRGGCAGAKGGGSSSGSGGLGGGALQLTARVAITVSGVLNAGGASGGGGGVLTESGGGGGGSGGYLGLEAPTVTLTSSAVLAANGGGGGGGAADSAPGLPGLNGQPSGVEAAGGLGALFKGGNGGAGGHQGSLAGKSGVKSLDGGGGGGGGAGHVVITSSNYTKNNATISAKATTP